MDKKLWNECVKFHGHECPGLAIGFKVGEAAIEKMNIKFSDDEEIVCVSENDACAVDAVQYIFSCTVGKGNMLFHPVGKMAFSFFNRVNNDSIRIYLKPINIDMSRRDEIKQHILNSSIDDLFVFSKPKYELPEKAKIFNTVICEKCGEGFKESEARLQDGKVVCRDCFIEYTRNV